MSCLLLFVIIFVLHPVYCTKKSYYSTKTPYKPPSKLFDLPLPPSGFEIVCTQIVARHGSRALEGRKYDQLTLALWQKAEEEDALTELGHQFGRDLQYFISLNDEIGFVYSKKKKRTRSISLFFK